MILAPGHPAKIPAEHQARTMDPLTNGGGIDTEQVRDLRCRQVLQIIESERYPIDRWKTVEGIPDELPELTMFDDALDPGGSAVVDVETHMVPGLIEPG